MNEEEILAMEPEEELDKLVATEVMGEPMPEFIPEDALELQLAGSPVKSPQGNWLCLCKYDEGDIPIWRPLSYSADISVAWLVVEKLRADFWCLEVHIADTCVVKAALQRTPPIFISMVSRDGIKGLPEAICKVALLAVIRNTKERRTHYGSH